MNKIIATERITKDLLFLKNLPTINISPDIIKRIQSQGSGECIGDIKIPCSIYLSLYKYNYEGKFIGQTLKVCIRDMMSRKANSEICEGVAIAVESMKMEEKAWFNFRKRDLHNIPDLPGEGCHFYIVLEDVKYKNSETLESKQIVSEECRKEAKTLFEKKQFQKAMKLYRKEINITEGIDKKKYKKQEIQQIMVINERAKRNFLKCFAKLVNFEESVSEAAEKYSKELSKKFCEQELVLLLRIHVLKQRKYLTQALEMAEEMLRTTKDCKKDIEDVIADIKVRISNKTKTSK